MPTSVSTVDSNGNITFARDEGVIIPIKEFLTDGSQVDISLLERWVNSADGFIRKELATDPGDVKGRRLILTATELNPYVSQIGQFTVMDEDGVVPQSLWEGLIILRSYVNG